MLVRTFQVRPETFSSTILPPLSIQEQVREFFSTNGVDLQVNPAAFFYNERTGTLLIHGKAGLLEEVERVLKTVEPKNPPRVELQIQMAEVSDAFMDEQLVDLLRPVGGAMILSGLLRSDDRTRSFIRVLTDGDLHAMLEQISQVERGDILRLPPVATVNGRPTQFQLEDHSSDPVLDPPFHAPPKIQKTK